MSTKQQLDILNNLFIKPFTDGLFDLFKTKLDVILMRIVMARMQCLKPDEMTMTYAIDKIETVFDIESDNMIYDKIDAIRNIYKILYLDLSRETGNQEPTFETRMAIMKKYYLFKMNATKLNGSFSFSYGSELFINFLSNPKLLGMKWINEAHTIIRHEYPGQEIIIEDRNFTNRDTGSDGRYAYQELLFENVRFVNVNFMCCVHEIKFYHCKFINVSFAGCCLKGCDYYGCNFKSSTIHHNQGGVYRECVFTEDNTHVKLWDNGKRVNEVTELDEMYIIEAVLCKVEVSSYEPTVSSDDADGLTTDELVYSDKLITLLNNESTSQAIKKYINFLWQEIED